jgi:hypothetical protein
MLVSKGRTMHRGYLGVIARPYTGAGERVLVLDEGNGARQVLDSMDGPVRSVVVGIIDDIVSGG